MCQCRPCTAGLQSESAELTHRDPIMCASAGGSALDAARHVRLARISPSVTAVPATANIGILVSTSRRSSVVRCHRANGYCAVNGKDFAVGPGTAKGIGT